jgi:hypothetical protein
VHILHAIVETVTRGFEQLLGRASGPLHLRLVITPAVTVFFAIRAGLNEVREGRAPFLVEIATNAAERHKLVHSLWKDIRRVLILVFVLDALYQVFVLRGYYIIQSLILAVVLAILPYSVVRSITNRLARAWRQRLHDSERP